MKTIKQVMKLAFMKSSPGEEDQELPLSYKTQKPQINSVSD